MELNIKQAMNRLEWLRIVASKTGTCTLDKVSVEDYLDIIKELTEENERLRGERDARSILNNECKNCIHYEICDEYVSPCESFPECEGGCKCFKNKADVVEVMRCKDCRLWTPSKRYGTDHNDVKRFYGNCAVTNRSEREDHYCSYGGRREK